MEFPTWKETGVRVNPKGPNEVEVLQTYDPKAKMWEWPKNPQGQTFSKLPRTSKG